MKSTRSLLEVLEASALLSFLGSVLFLVSGPHVVTEVIWAFLMMWASLFVYVASRRVLRLTP